MDHHSTGLVLRKYPLTETSLIIHWLTPEFGRISTVAKGALRHKSPFRGKLDLFHLVEFTFIPSQKSDLHTLGEASLLDPHSFLRSNLSGFQQASWFALLIEKTTERGTPIPEPYHLMLDFLAALEGFPPRPLLLFASELKLLAELGLTPPVRTAVLRPETGRLIEQLIELPLRALEAVTPPPPLETELGRFLARFLESQFGPLPRLREAAFARLGTVR